MKNKKTIFIIIICVLTLVIGYLAYKTLPSQKDNTDIASIANEKDFDFKIIHMANKEDDNYLISPLSIAYALSILNEGASNNTKEQISKVLGDYNLKTNTTYEDKIGIANALFIKDDDKNDIKDEFINNVKNKYDGEILFDKFETPDVINNWTKEKTYGMIDHVLDDIDKDFVLGIMNALAIDVEWKYKFQGELTNKKQFNNYDKTVSIVDMMNTENTFTYIENDNAKGIIKEYEKYGNNELVFIAILPNTDIKEYINNFDKKELNSLLSNRKESSSELDLNLKLPKFTYDYTYEKFKEDLISLGIQDAFNPAKARFDNILKPHVNYSLYVSQAIHKTHIELNENGTKAAAITYFGLNKATAIFPEKEKIEIVFDRPFLYIIKDKNNDNIWFFGTVYNIPESK